MISVEYFLARAMPTLVLPEAVGPMRAIRRLGWSVLVWDINELLYCISKKILIFMVIMPEIFRAVNIILFPKIIVTITITILVKKICVLHFELMDQFTIFVRHFFGVFPESLILLWGFTNAFHNFWEILCRFLRIINFGYFQEKPPH